MAEFSDGWPKRQGLFAEAFSAQEVSLRSLIGRLEARLENLEREGLDHHSEEWQEAFAERQLVWGSLVFARSWLSLR